ncbi:MAG: XdhC family protein, partial [Saprospiraceae bacterium]|nr:XdhC family protein [Saprospiraceae bacterium]
MKEIRSILQQYDKIKSTNKKMALATVVYVEGSSYRREGARMLVVEDGTWIGGISGGCLEGDALRKAKNAIVKDQSSIVRYDTREEDAFQIGVGLGCNGIIDVLITPLGNETNNTINILKDCVNSRIANVLITFIDPVDRNSIGDMILGKENILQQHIGNQHIIDLLGIELDLIKEEQKSKIYR